MRRAVVIAGLHHQPCLTGLSRWKCWNAIQRIVRLVLISPDKDWRKGQTYAWKLDNAWMSDQNVKWLHWNVESYINSDIQVPNDNNVFSCDRLEFHFDPIGFHGQGAVVSNSRLVLTNVQIGANLASTNGKAREEFIPCNHHTDGNCSVIDGVAKNDPGLPGMTNNGPVNWQIAGLFGLLLFITIAFVCWCRRRGVKLYEQLSPTPEEDLTLEVEDTYQDPKPRSTVQGVANETG